MWQAFVCVCVLKAFKDAFVCETNYFCHYSAFSSVQSFSRVWLFATPWTAAHQASLSFSISQSLLKLMSIELMMPSNHFILCRPLLLPLKSFPASGSFPMSQLLASVGQSIGVSASTSVLPMNTQDWSPLGLTGLISFWSKGVFSNTTVQKHQFFGTLPSLRSNSHIHTRLQQSLYSWIIQHGPAELQLWASHLPL